VAGYQRSEDLADSIFSVKWYG